MNNKTSACARASGWAIWVAALYPVLASAAVRCDELGLDRCLEARGSAVTSGSILWDDGSTTYLSAPDGAFQTVTYAPYEYGMKTQLYSDGTLQSSVQGYGGLGPAFQASYTVDKAPGSSAADASGGGVFYQGQVSSAFLHGQTGVQDPSLAFSTAASAQIGTNHAAVQVNGTSVGSYTLDAGNTLNPGHTGTVSTRWLGTAQSYWNEQSSFANGSTVPFTVQLDGSIDANGWVWYTLTATDPSGQVHSILNESILGSQKSGSFNESLQGSFVPVAGVTYTLRGSLIVYAQDNAATAGTVSANEDALHTAKVTAIGLTPGDSVRFGADNSPLYAVVNVSAVPEPSTWALTVAGLALMGAIRRRRAG